MNKIAAINNSKTEDTGKKETDEDQSEEKCSPELSQSGKLCADTDISKASTIKTFPAPRR